ncbi:MAG: protein-glutamate O-methyltransferase CheR [candidate division WOR-3 bacterium]
MEDLRYLELIKNFIKRKMGIDLSAYRESYLLRRVKIRMAKTHSHTLSSYYNLLLKEEKESQNLIDTIGINVSVFFRDRDVFETIKNTILPYFKNRDFIKIWSAGCAQGEEAYTLSILFLDQGFENFKIFATDFDSEIIEMAKNGIFEGEKLEDFPFYLRIKYIEKINNKFKVKDFVKKHIEFKIHDLLSSPFDNDFDIILCRNVLIYMQKDAQRKVFENLTSSLKKDGILILGKVEMIHPDFENFYLPLNIKEKIFKKII